MFGSARKPRLHNHTDVGQGFSPADKAALKGCPWRA
jgi:hypothetical protein